MKIFTFLASIVAFAEALTPAQENAAQREFRKFDHDHNGKIASGAVYGALSQLDKKLTEAQLQKAAGHNKKVSMKQFMQIFAKLEGGKSGAASKYPKGCTNYFDGCNHCIIKNGKELGCTKMYCGQIYDGPKKKAFCTVYENGKRCKSATSCSDSKKYNCYTREVWSNAKKAFCCKTRHMGCPHKQHSKKPLKANSVCYAFYESNPAGGVNRKNDCPKGYKCASNSNMMSFNTVMRCVKASVSGGSSTTIPQDCTSWYDGCNTCFVRSGKILGCTRRACFRKGKAYCRQHAAKQQYNDVMHYEK
jgi:hypothetical protein